MSQNILILGGLGFIGRNLVEAFAASGKCAKIRVADKVMPALAGLSAAQKTLFESDTIDYKQANLANQGSIEKVFAKDFGEWDCVINCAAETKYSQAEQVYKENVVDLAARCAAEAAKVGVKRWIELSTGQVYDSGSKASDEDAKIKPWTKLADAKLAAEGEVQKALGDKVVVLRLAVVYGPADTTGVMPRLVCGATYTTSGEKMTFLWGKDLKLHTVHVADVAAACIHASAADGGVKAGVYNLVDDNDTDQGSINELISQLFGIETDFLGGMKSKVATAVAMKTVADTANEKHLGPWSALCKEKGITNTPLTPYLDEELLYKNAMALNAAKFVGTDFSLKNPKMTIELLKESLQYQIDNNAFPAGILK